MKSKVDKYPTEPLRNPILKFFECKNIEPRDSTLIFKKVDNMKIKVNKDG